MDACYMCRNESYQVRNELDMIGKLNGKAKRFCKEYENKLINFVM